MYKWSVKITTKTGAVIKGVLQCKYGNSSEVSNMLLARTSASADFVGISTEDEKGHLLYDTHEVAVIEIRPWKGEPHG